MRRPLIGACARAGRTDEAERCVASMEKRGVSANVNSYNPLIAAYARAGRTEEAERCLASMEERGGLLLSSMEERDLVIACTEVHATGVR